MLKKQQQQQQQQQKHALELKTLSDLKLQLIFHFKVYILFDI